MFCRIVISSTGSLSVLHYFPQYTRYQTKTPLQFGKYVGAYIDDGLNDPIFLELAKALQQMMPRIMKGHDLRYLWAYKYDSEWSSGINLHADEAGESNIVYFA